MATNITSRFMNQNKRYSEAVVVTVPSVLSAGGGRSQAQPLYIQGSDPLVADVIEEDTYVKKIYLNIIEAYPAGATITVAVGGVTAFTAVDGTVNGVTVSAEEDNHFSGSDAVTVTVGGITGDVVTGKLSVVLDTIHASLHNGQYAS